MRTFIIFCVFFIWTAAFASNDKYSFLEQAAKIDRFAWNGPGFLKNLSVEQIRKLGTIEKEVKEEVDNPYYEGEKTPYYTFHFKEGLKVHCRFVSHHASGPHVQFVSIEISSETWPILNNLKVGESINRVNEYLGKPDAEGKQMILYRGETEEVIFSHENGIVTKIEFYYYVG
jgi:hypothetical protein